MSAAALLSRLVGVRSTGAGRWLARCPAHEDRSPSLSIRELADGRVLIHDFAGCSVEEVLSTVGLDFDALFPERAIADHVPRERRPFPAGDVLQAVAGEALLIAVTSANQRQGVPLTQDEHDRVMLAAARLQSAARLANG